jgi:hypothetical protein
MPLDGALDELDEVPLALGELKEMPLSLVEALSNLCLGELKELPLPLSLILLQTSPSAQVRSPFACKVPMEPLISHVEPSILVRSSLVPPLHCTVSPSIVTFLLNFDDRQVPSYIDCKRPNNGTSNVPCWKRFGLLRSESAEAGDDICD